MPRPLPYRVVVRKLAAAGFLEASQKGSHVKFARETDAGRRIVLVPRHREVRSGTLSSILRQASSSACSDALSVSRRVLDSRAPGQGALR